MHIGTYYVFLYDAQLAALLAILKLPNNLSIFRFMSVI